jgi:hypothetical protein
MSIDTARTAPARTAVPWWHAATAVVAAAVAAIVVNELVMLVGRAAGASFVLDDRGTPHVVTAVDVVVATWPMVVGTALGILLARWRTWFLRVAQVVGGGLALLSVAGPLLAVTDSGTRLALAFMHVVVGAAAVLALEVVHRRAVS